MNDFEKAFENFLAAKRRLQECYKLVVKQKQEVEEKLNDTPYDIKLQEQWLKCKQQEKKYQLVVKSLSDEKQVIRG